MMGRLEVFCGSMYASKSTALQRQGKRHLIAGRKVVFIKPSIDGRYGDAVVTTHDGEEMDALNIFVTDSTMEDITRFPEVIKADVICIDEIQFFPEVMIQHIDKMVYQGKLIYVAGLDLTGHGEPFGIMPFLMAKAEHVEKFQAVCVDCGKDAWVSAPVKEVKEKVSVGNHYKPVCRSCSIQYIGGAK